MKNIFLILFVLSTFIFISCDNTNSDDNAPCFDISCSDLGECGIDNDNNPVCICNSGYHSVGLNCIEDGVTPTCDNFSCPKNAKCELQNDTPKCICDNGYILDNNICIEEINACSDDPCTEENKTVCEVSGSSYVCKCDSGYTETENGCEKLKNLHLRLMAANTTTGKYGLYQSDGIRIFQAIDADIIMVQEFLYKNDIEELVEKIYGKNCLSERKCYFYQGGRSKPNGIMSKYPIIDTGYWKDSGYNDRNLDWAIIDIPGDVELYAISVHLSTDGGEQTAPAKMIAQKIAAHKQANPGEYYYTVGGDFNGSTAVRAFGTNGAFVTSDPKPESEKCRRSKSSYKCTNTNHGRTKHYDWILESSNLSKLRVTTKLCKDNNSDCLNYPKGLVFDTREYINKSDYISPARLNDSTDTYMQHMAIIKDFEIKF